MTTIHATAPAAPVKFHNHLYFRVLVGMFAGIVVGHFWPDVGASLKPLGDAFVKIVKMMIAPVVFCTIVSGITSMSDNREIAKTLIKAMGLFYALTITALVIGLVTVHLLKPGVGMNIDPASIDPSVVAQYTNHAAPSGLSISAAPDPDHVLRPVRGRRSLAGPGDRDHHRLCADPRRQRRPPVTQGIEAFSHVLFNAFAFLMKLAPFGAFGAMAFTVGSYGIKSIGSLGLLITTSTLPASSLSSWCWVCYPAARLRPVEAAALCAGGAADRAGHLVQ